jgi:DNA-directed RNA polymerase specialized sigma subunit, sigma24 homolog
MIDRLPEKYRKAIVLTDIERLTQKEMAEKLGLSSSGAKSRVQRSRKKLKEMLLECCHFEFDRSGNITEYQLKEQNSPCCTQGSVTFKGGRSQSQINDRRRLLKSIEVTYQPELLPASTFKRGATCTKKPTEE